MSTTRCMAVVLSLGCDLPQWLPSRDTALYLGQGVQTFGEYCTLLTFEHTA